MVRPPQPDSFLDVVSASLDDVPMALGTVAMAVIRLMSNDSVSINEVSRAVSADAGLSARIVRKANSAFYASETRTTTLPSAILKIGFTATRSIAIAASVQSMFRQGEGDGLEQKLWQHSLAVGTGCRLIARRVAPRRADEAFLTGLLHDIGKLVLLQRFPEQYKPILIETRDNPKKRLDVEMTRMGFTHADLGVMVMDRWNFAPSEIRAVQYHHNPYAMPDQDADGNSLSSALEIARIVALANMLAKTTEQTAGPHSSPITIIKSDHFEFSQDELIKMAEDIRESLADELQIFGLEGTNIY